MTCHHFTQVSPLQSVFAPLLAQSSQYVNFPPLPFPSVPSWTRTVLVPPVPPHWAPFPAVTLHKHPLAEVQESVHCPLRRQRPNLGPSLLSFLAGVSSPSTS